MTTNDEQYVPSEGAVKLAWAERRLFLDSMGEGCPSPDAVYNAEIDRFLARVRRDAWHEGMLAGDCAAYNGHTTPPNPYEETP